MRWAAQRDPSGAGPCLSRRSTSRSPERGDDALQRLYVRILPVVLCYSDWSCFPDAAAPLRLAFLKAFLDFGTKLPFLTLDFRLGFLCCYWSFHHNNNNVMYCQVWWPILEIGPLHLTHPSAHTQQWVVCSHTPGAVGSHCSSARGAVGGSVPCSRAPQSWYWRWRECCSFTIPTFNPCRTWDSNPQPLDYKSDSLTTRPRLPHHHCSPERYCILITVLTWL